MKYLGIDYGHKRVGLSVGDDELFLAVPIDAAVEATESERLLHIEREVGRREIGHLVLGYPYNMDGSVGFKAKEVDSFEKKLRKFGLPISLMDERLTSHQVERDFVKISEKPRSSKRQKKMRSRGQVDSSAAALILQDFLDAKNNECR